MEMTIEGRQCTAGLACLEGQERPLHKFTEANLSDNKYLGCFRYEDHRIFAKESYRHGIKHGLRKAMALQEKDLEGGSTPASRSPN